MLTAVGGKLDSEYRTEPPSPLHDFVVGCSSEMWLSLHNAM